MDSATIKQREKDYYRFVEHIQACTKFVAELSETLDNYAPPHAPDNETVAFCAAISVSAINFVEKVGEFSKKVYELLPDK